MLKITNTFCLNKALLQVSTKSSLAAADQEHSLKFASHASGRRCLRSKERIIKNECGSVERK